MSRNYVELSNQPPLYQVNALPNNMAKISLFDDAQQISSDEGERWIATEYSSTIPNFPGIETRINSNYGAWLAQAKEEARKEEERVAQKLPSEERFKQIEAAIMELAEIATGGEA